MNMSQVERRAGQRFDFQVPVAVRVTGTNREGYGFTQNLSAKGLTLCTDLSLAEADILEVTLVMPAEITMSENMRLRCRGRVLRVVSSGVAAKCFASVHLDQYEYLPEDAGLSGLRKLPSAGHTPVSGHDSAMQAP